jgi:peptidoglycan/xylan/chitin deacetylase (PgdA/CDA1 family)
MVILKRDLVARISSSVGLTALLERFGGRPCLIVLNYHRIGAAGRSAFDRGLFSAPPEEFDAQMSSLRRRYEVLSVDEVIAAVEDPSRLRRTSIAVTFDDGYLDNYTTAFPILRRHGIPATFFLVTHWTGTGTIPWWDAIAFMVRRTEQRMLRFDYPAARTIAIGGGDRRASIRRVLRICKSPAVDSLDRFVAEVSRATGVAVPTGHPGKRRFLSWDEAREMRDAGMSFGSHTDGHPILSKLSYDEQRLELQVSADQLRRELGVQRPTLGFPVGSRASFNHDSIAALADAGYRAAFTFTGAVNGPNCAPFSISRVAVDSIEMPLLRFRMAAAATFGSWGVPL